MTLVAASFDASRRAAKKAETRQALIDAALELCARRGYEQTTAADIARAAGVSARTFFRYFPTKEGVLFFGRLDFMRSLVDVFLARPDVLSDLEAFSSALLVLAPGIERQRQPTVRYGQIVRSSALLRGRDQEELDRNAAMLSDAIAQRRGLPGADPACRLLARVALVTMQHAVSEWLSAGPRARLADQVVATFGCIESLALPAVRAGTP